MTQISHTIMGYWASQISSYWWPTRWGLTLNYTEHPKDNTYWQHPRENKYWQHPRENKYWQHPRENKYWQHPTENKYWQHPTSLSWLQWTWMTFWISSHNSSTEVWKTNSNTRQCHSLSRDGVQLFIVFTVHLEGKLEEVSQVAEKLHPRRKEQSWYMIPWLA